MTTVHVTSPRTRRGPAAVAVSVSSRASRSARVACEALGETVTWLSVEIGAETSTYPTVDDLLADDGAELDVLIARWFGDDPAISAPAAGIVGMVAWMLYTPRLLTIRSRRSMIELDPYGVRFCGGEDDGPSRVFLPRSARLCSLVTDDDVEGAYRALVEEAVLFFGPLVDALRRRVSVGRRALWGRVVDVFAAVGPTYEDVSPEPGEAALAMMRRAVAGTPLDQRLEVIDIDHAGGVRRMVRTSSCCLSYLTPPIQAEGDDDDRPPWCDGELAGYCMACPLIPIEEAVARARYLIDRSNLRSGA